MSAAQTNLGKRFNRAAGSKLIAYFLTKDMQADETLTGLTSIYSTLRHAVTFERG